jgi:hypothetical protein
MLSKDPDNARPIGQLGNGLAASEVLGSVHVWTAPLMQGAL